MREMKMRLILLIFLLNFQAFPSGCFLLTIKNWIQNLPICECDQSEAEWHYEVDHSIMDDCAFNQQEALSIAIAPLPITLLCALVLMVIYCYSRSRAVGRDAAITTPSPEPQQKRACQCGAPGSAGHFGDRTGPVGSAYFKLIGSIDRKALTTSLMRLQFIDKNSIVDTGNVEKLLEEALLEKYKKTRWPPKTYSPSKCDCGLRKDIDGSANISSELAPVGSAYFKLIGSIDRKALTTSLMQLQFIDKNNIVNTGNVEKLLEEALLEKYKKTRWPPKTYSPSKCDSGLRKDIDGSANISSELAPVNIETESLSPPSTESIKEPETKMRTVKTTAHVCPTPATADDGVKKQGFARRMRNFFRKLLGFFLCCRIIRE